MRNVHLFLRRLAGLLGLVFGGHRVRAARRALKAIDASRYASRILSDGVQMNDIPSPSDNEELRTEFIVRRLGEFGVSNVFHDGGNTLAMFPAFGTQRDFVLLVAEVGDVDYSPLGNSVRLVGDKALGGGLGERSLGAAALLVFAEYAQATGFHWEKNLLLCFTPSSTVDEKEVAFRQFLDGWADRIACGVLVKGTGLGVVESKHVGSYRLSLTVTSEDHDLLLSPQSPVSAAAILGQVAARVGSIPVPEGSLATVSIARMESGDGFGHWAARGEMDIEILAEDDGVLESLKGEVIQTIEESTAGSKIQIDTLVRLQRSAGDPQRNAPLLTALKEALGRVAVDPEPGYVSDKISLLNVRGIPAVAVGITREADSPDEVRLEPIASGFRQLLLVVETAAAVAVTLED